MVARSPASQSIRYVQVGKSKIGARTPTVRHAFPRNGAKYARSLAHISLLYFIVIVHTHFEEQMLHVPVEGSAR